MASAVDAAVAVGSSAATIIGGYFAFRTKLVDKLSAPAAVSAAEAQQSSTEAESARLQVLAFASGYADLYRKIEELKDEIAHLRDDARLAGEDARAAKAAEERCITEQHRLEAMLEGILRDRSS